jgi:hypothetical protein
MRMINRRSMAYEVAGTLRYQYEIVTPAARQQNLWKDDSLSAFARDPPN